jgi:hypothetical protein
MSSRLLDRLARPIPPSSSPAAVRPEPAYDTLNVLVRLRDELTSALDSRWTAWREAPIFFFDRRRQVELEASRPAAQEAFAELANSIRAVLPALLASVEVRRVARAIAGLHVAARALAPACSAARDLDELLAVPDDEVFLVLFPARGAGFRLVVRGVADVGQFQVLAIGAIAAVPSAGPIPDAPVAARFIAAYRDANPATPGGVPMVVEASQQLYSAGALRPDGSLPREFERCEFWLWPALPAASVPSIDGERVVVMGPPVFAMAWDVSRRFPALAAEVRVIETLSPARVAQTLARLIGRPNPLYAAPALSSES